MPIALLRLGYAAWWPLAWLVSIPLGEDWLPLANALPVVRAMMIGVALIRCFLPALAAGAVVAIAVAVR